MLREFLNTAGQITDLLWNFPTNFDWYRNIPVLGNLSFAIILLIGSGVYFTISLRFVQLRHFKYGILAIARRDTTLTGISPLASFLLSTAMRVGPGNILGVTGAVCVGGPGAIFWMWIAAFFGMATAYTESTLSQIFKEKKDNEYIGGMAFYGRKLLKDSAAAGIFLSVLYIVYALLCFPAQGFNSVSAVEQVVQSISTVAPSPSFNKIVAIIVMLTVAVISFGGIRRITKATNLLVPIMATIYILTTIVLILSNADSIPCFITKVFYGAFNPDAVLGGSFGTVLMQGVRRGLMSNEAGQGTMTMAAAASDAKCPAEQGAIQAVGVFLDTMIICTLSGFIVTMASLYPSESGKLAIFVSSATALSPLQSVNIVISIIISICFGLFAFTCLLGFLSFAEISANRISQNKVFIHIIRILCLIVTAAGILTSIEGIDLSALWNLSDMANLILVFCNIPLLFLGFRRVRNASSNFDSDCRQY